MCLYIHRFMQKAKDDIIYSIRSEEQPWTKLRQITNLEGLFPNITWYTTQNHHFFSWMSFPITSWTVCLLINESLCLRTLSFFWHSLKPVCGQKKKHKDIFFFIDYNKHQLGTCYLLLPTDRSQELHNLISPPLPVDSVSRGSLG